MGFPPLRAVLLDNNGTCFDDVHLAYGSACTTLAHWGVTAFPSLEQYRNEMDSNWREWYYKYGVPRDITGDQMNVLRRGYYDAHGSSAKYRPELFEFLLFCRERQLKLAIVSAEVTTVLMQSLEREQLADYFDHIEAEAWPKMPALVRTLVRLGVPPEQAVYVDDSVEGNTSAKAIGMRTVGFTNRTAYASEARIRAAGPETTAENFDVLTTTILPWLE